MKLSEILSYLEEIAPGSYQESYDNSGLITGCGDQDISKLLVCLDADSKAIDYAILQKCNAVLSHHPAIFKALKSFTEDTREGSLLVKSIRSHLALLSCHTNFDAVTGGLTDRVCSRIGLNNVIILKKASACGDYGHGRYGSIPETGGKAFLDLLMSKFSLNVIRSVGELPDSISTVAVFNGSYDRDIMTSLLDIKPDVLITGDLKYHDAQELMERGIYTVDAGHYGTESIFVEEMAGILKSRFPQLEVIEYKGADLFTYHGLTT